MPSRLLLKKALSALRGGDADTALRALTALLEADVALYLHGLQQLLAYLEMAEPMPPVAPVTTTLPLSGFMSWR